MKWLIERINHYKRRNVMREIESLSDSDRCKFLRALALLQNRHTVRVEDFDEMMASPIKQLRAALRSMNDL